MIYPGLCSVSFNKLSSEDVIKMVERTELKGIEWSGNDHAPHGDMTAARKIKMRCEDAGIKLPSYGSYYKAGYKNRELPFKKVLDSAQELGVSVIRIWAGTKNRELVSDSEYQTILDDVLECAEICEKSGLKIAFEYHQDTLTNSIESTAELASRLKHGSVLFYWQPAFGRDQGYCIRSLENVLPRLANIHVYHWTMGSPEKNIVHQGMRELVFPEDFFKHPLNSGASLWSKYFKLVEKSHLNRWAYLEFIKNDDPEQFEKDAVTLCQLLKS